jgi:hypothetical protein
MNAWGGLRVRVLLTSEVARLEGSPERNYFHSISASSPNTTARAALSSSRSISNSPKLRVFGLAQNSPMR